jgi:hypothetical protein
MGFDEILMRTCFESFYIASMLNSIHYLKVHYNRSAGTRISRSLSAVESWDGSNMDVELDFMNTDKI